MGIALKRRATYIKKLHHWNNDEKCYPYRNCHGKRRIYSK